MRERFPKALKTKGYSSGDADAENVLKEVQHFIWFSARCSYDTGFDWPHALHQVYSSICKGALRTTQRFMTERPLQETV
jgi:hypothetical protein